MRNIAVRFGLSLGFIALYAPRLFGDVTVTEPIGGNNISADKAVNSTNGAAFTPLGNIVLAEGASADFAPGTNRTLILTAPDGWRFNPAAAASVTFLNGRDITAASIASTFSNLTVTLSVAGTGRLDQLTISGMQVQPLQGAGGAGGK